MKQTVTLEGQPSVGSAPQKSTKNAMKIFGGRVASVKVPIYQLLIRHVYCNRHYKYSSVTDITQENHTGLILYMVPEHLGLLASEEGKERGLEPISPRYQGTIL